MKPHDSVEFHVQALLDTNVLISALRSRNGASFAILSELGRTWTRVISVSLIAEYEATGKREASRLGIPAASVDEIIRAFCYYGRPYQFILDCGPFYKIRTTTSSRSLQSQRIRTQS